MKGMCYLAVIAVLIVPFVSGCTPTATDELASSLTELEQEQVEARRLNSEALTQGQDPAQQRKLLEQALYKDQLFGEAHNNLGVVLYKQGRLYEAAGHLQRASELLSGSSIPLVNLAILHATMGQWDRALPYAREAYEKDHHDFRALRILAECLVEKRDNSNELAEALQQLVMVSPDEPLRKWAMRQLKTNQDNQAYTE